jgi:two-component system, NtrC family, sensor kinase
MRKILLFLIILSTLKSFAQTKTIDSLKKALHNYKKDDTIKVGMLYKYSSLLYKADIHVSIQYTYEGMHIANKLNRPDLAAAGDIMLASFYGIENRADSAVSVCLDGLKTAERLRLDKLLPSLYSQLGDSYRLLQNYEQAVYYDNKFLDIANSEKNDRMILSALLLLVSLYQEHEQWDKVKVLVDRALPFARAQKNRYSLGRLYWAMGRQYHNANNFQEAVNNYHAAFEVWKNMKDYHNMDYSLVLLSEAFNNMNNKDSAGWYAYAALDTAKKFKLKKETRDAYGVLFFYHFRYKYYQKALEERLILDSIDYAAEDEHAEQTTLRAEMKYDQEKKELLAAIEQKNKVAAEQRARNLQYGVIIAFVLLACFLFYNNRQKQRAKIKIEKAYSELKTTQAQLIQNEKMASLGELTAGIAHEIQNPLNFVNNFSEVNIELADELKTGLNHSALPIEEKNNLLDIVDDITKNQEKINHHGKRADAIVKGMLQHSRISSGFEEPTDINALADEYLRLSYHGLRAKDKSFNATMKTDFDTSIGNINIIPQDIGRVFLNLYNNAFYTISEKKKLAEADYEPTVSVSTKKTENKMTISVKDNGNGIPQKVVDKIFQPFFTTKPTGQGTGLGLSLSYDIVKAHGGEIKVETKEREGTEFVVRLPLD